MGTDFTYLIEKIKEAPFSSTPYKHITIDNLFSDNHFNAIINDPQIKTCKFKTHRDLLDSLISIGYSPAEFPGCITCIENYLKFLQNPRKYFSRRARASFSPSQKKY